MITQHELKQWLDYNPDTGIFIWVSRPSSKIKIGQTSGSPDKNGYLQIMLKGKNYKAHRLAFLFMTGEMPTCDIDHINRCTSDNRFCNLRKCDGRENSLNTTLQRNNTSGAKGICWDKHRNKWYARATCYGKQIHIGRFDNFEDAVKARDEFTANNYNSDFYRKV